MIFAIGTQDELLKITQFAMQLGVTFPVLFDSDSGVFQSYFQLPAFKSIFPQQALIDAEGVVAYHETGYYPLALRAAVEAALEE